MNMKKLFYLLFVAVLAVGLAACDKDDPKPRNGGNNYGPGGGGGSSDLDISFVADQLWCGYYGDYLKTGKGLYWLEINNGKIDENGNLTSAGYAIWLAVNGPLPKEGESLTLPVGTYKTSLGKNDNFKILNEDFNEGSYYSFVDIFEEGKTEYYTDKISSGTMTISNNKGKYTVKCDLNMFYIDENGKQVADGNIQCTYTGMINVSDCTSQVPGGGEDPDSDLDVKFTADQFWCGYYGDYLGLGTGMYMIEINNGTIDDAGYLTSAGNAITLAVNGAMPAEGETVTLPVGTYTTDLEMTDNFKIINEDVGFYSCTPPHPDDPTGYSPRSPQRLCRIFDPAHRWPTPSAQRTGL